MMKVSPINSKVVQAALETNLLDNFVFDAGDLVAASEYRIEGKNRLANQILGVDGALFVQKHFQQHVSKIPDYLSIDLLALLACVRLTGQEAAKLLKAHGGEMFTAASLFLLRAGIDINKIPALARGFHTYPNNPDAGGMDESFLYADDFERLPQRLPNFGLRLWNVVRNLDYKYGPGVDAQHPARQAKAQVLNWIRYALFKPNITGLAGVQLSPKGVYNLLNQTVASEMVVQFATVEQYREVAAKLGASEGDVLFQFDKEEVDLILATPFVEDKGALGHSFGVGVDGFRKLHKADRKMLTVGEWSSCCQRLGGAGAMAIALCKASPKADTFAISVNGEDCGSMVVFALSDGSFIIDSIERRRMLSDEAIEALLKKLAASHKVYAGYNLEGRFSINYDTEDYLSKGSSAEWKELYNFAEEFYVDTCPKVWRIVP